MIETAARFAVPPSVILGIGKGRWSEKDRLLTLAHTKYLKSLCPGCGHPRDRCWDTDVEVERVSYLCGVCAVSERDSSEGERRPGEKVAYMPTAPDVNDADELLPTFD